MSKVIAQWKKSTIAFPLKQKRTIKALGFKKLNSTVEHQATPQILGMLNSVRHLVSWEVTE